jgi:predicted nucleic acid-binding protein
VVACQCLNAVTGHHENVGSASRISRLAAGRSSAIGFYREQTSSPRSEAAADTGFFVSIYLKNAYSTKADLFLSPGARPCITPLHFAEWAHAIAQQVFRRQMTTAEANRVDQELHEDRTAGVWPSVDVPETSLDACVDLGRRYRPKPGVQTLDSLHVACALELKAERFWTFDDRQLNLARTVGLKTT